MLVRSDKHGRYLSVHYRFSVYSHSHSLSLCFSDRFYCEICTFDTGESILIQRKEKNNQIHFFRSNRYHISHITHTLQFHILVWSMNTKSYNFNSLKQRTPLNIAQQQQQGNWSRKMNWMQILRQNRKSNSSKGSIEMSLFTVDKISIRLYTLSSVGFLSYHWSNSK